LTTEKCLLRVIILQRLPRELFRYHCRILEGLLCACVYRIYGLIRRETSFRSCCFVGLPEVFCACIHKTGYHYLYQRKCIWDFNLILFLILILTKAVKSSHVFVILVQNFTFTRNIETQGIIELRDQGMSVNCFQR
jgi:hypothetical protein